MRMLQLEVLSVAIVNYFTSSIEIFKPSNIQLNQVKNLLACVQSNFLQVAQIIAPSKI
jgi:hypothetical protein